MRGREPAFSDATQVPYEFTFSRGARRVLSKAPPQREAAALGVSHPRDGQRRVVPVDPYGNKLLHKPLHKVEGGKVYATDAYGRVRQQKFEIKNERHVRSESERGRRAGH